MGDTRQPGIQEISTTRQRFFQKRWTVLFGGFLLSLMGGMSYAWGSFVVPLVKNWGWTAAQANLPFTVMIIVFAVTMIPAGWIQDKMGPRGVATLGSFLFLLGYGLAGLLRQIPNPAWLVFSYGFLVGVACGLTYACIAPTARKWYPDRPGFAVSTAVMGFGLAAVVFAPLKKSMIDQWGVDGTFFVLAVFVTIVSIAGARLVKNPPDGYVPSESPKSLHPRQPHRDKQIKDVTPRVFVKSPIFYILWLALAMVIGGGLTAIGLITAYGEMKLNLAPAVAAIAMSAYAMVNGLGRPFAGYFSDRLGTLRVMIVVYVIQAIVFFALPWVAVNLPLLIICSLFLGLGYATTFALFPVIVADGFGTRYLGMNYGLVFSAFGVGALTSLIGSSLLDSTGSFTPAFLLAGSTTLVGLILLVLLQTKMRIQGKTESKKI
jgi:MFS transporter, OFA family, oxalate/formate antiporter